MFLFGPMTPHLRLVSFVATIIGFSIACGNDLQFTKNNQTVFTVASNGTCSCNAYSGDGSLLTGLQNQPTVSSMLSLLQALNTTVSQMQSQIAALNETNNLLTAQVTDLQSQITSLNQTVILFAECSASTVLQNVVISQVIYDTINTDTHNAYNSGTGIYTIPVAGSYFVHAVISLDSRGASGIYADFYIAVNGTCDSPQHTYGSFTNQLEQFAVPNVGTGVEVSGVFAFNTGDQITECVYIDASDYGIYPAPEHNRLHIIRVGN